MSNLCTSFFLVPKYCHRKTQAKDKYIKWIVSDISEFNTPDKFYLWHDRTVFYFLTKPSDRKNYITNLKKI